MTQTRNRNLKYLSSTMNWSDSQIIRIVCWPTNLWLQLQSWYKNPSEKRRVCVCVCVCVCVRACVRACVRDWPVRAGDDLFTVDDHELLQDLTGELLAALGAVCVPAHTANTHVLHANTQTHTHTHVTVRNTDTHMKTQTQTWQPDSHRQYFKFTVKKQKSTKTNNNEKHASEDSHGNNS